MKTQKDEAKEQLRSSVESIVKAIEEGYACEDPSMYDGQYEEGDIINACDYLQDALDIEYRVGTGDKGKLEYRSAKILVAFGGPNIWIDTGAQKVIGAWWGDYFEMSYDKDAMGIDDFCRELFECR